MKNTTIALILLALTGCATQNFVHSAPQNYRLKNSDTPLNITGKADVRQTYGVITDTASVAITISFDGEGVIFGQLDNTFNGDFKGRDYKGHSTSANCTSKPVSQTDIEVRCLVFVDNERTVTLTF